MKTRAGVIGWCVADSANLTGAYSPHGVIAKVSAVYETKKEAEGHLEMMKSMPKFLHKKWVVVQVSMRFFTETEETTTTD